MKVGLRLTKTVNNIEIGTAIEIDTEIEMRLIPRFRLRFILR